MEMRRFFSRLILMTPLCALAASAPVRLNPVPALNFRLDVSSLTLASTEGQPLVRGQVKLRSAWRLTSETEDFGGISALGIDLGHTGPELLAISDAGGVFHLPLNLHGGDNAARMAPLPDGCSNRIQKRDQDLEALTLDAVSGDWWVALESNNKMCRFDHEMAATRAVGMPRPMRHWPATGGPEAITHLSDGRFAVFSERADDANAPITPLLIFDSDPVTPGTPFTALRYRAPEGYRPVDAVEVSSGRLLVLHRRFTLPFRFTSVITLVDIRGARAEAPISGRVIAEISNPDIAENYEGIAAQRRDDETLIWLVSDDNFFWLQRTLLLQLSWAG
jgi:hypothetical protein